jgi:hypothetical protein
MRFIVGACLAGLAFAAAWLGCGGTADTPLVPCGTAPCDDAGGADGAVDAGGADVADGATEHTPDANVDAAQEGGDHDAGAHDAAPDATSCAATLESDPKNCGTCGHDCLGGGCVAGRCAPAALVSALGAPFYLALDETNIYWTDSSPQGTATLWRLPKLAAPGTMPQGVAQVNGPLQSVAADATGVYFGWGDGSATTGDVVLSSGAGTTNVAAAPSPNSIALDATSVYWTTDGLTTPRGVFRAAKAAGAAPTKLVSSSNGGSLHATVSQDKLFWVDDFGSDGLHRCTLPQCADDVLISALDNANAVVAFGTNVFTTDFTSIHQFPQSSPAGAIVAPIITGQALPFAMAVDDKDFYWINLGNYTMNFKNGDVRHCPVVGGAVTCTGLGSSAGEVVMAAPGTLPRAIAMDAKAVYWTVQGTGAVYRLAR